MNPLDTETIVAREHFHDTQPPKLSAFSPRPLERLAVLKPPTSNLKIECQNWYRHMNDSTQTTKPSVNYRLWKEAAKFYRVSKSDTTISLQDVDWATWRNYSHLYGYCDENKYTKG